MISKERFVSEINKWDKRFGLQILEEAFDKLDSISAKPYVLGLVSSRNESFHFEQMDVRELEGVIDTHINEYETNPNSYLERILVVNLMTGRIWKNPTEWGIFCGLRRAAHW